MFRVARQAVKNFHQPQLYHYRKFASPAIMSFALEQLPPTPTPRDYFRLQFDPSNVPAKRIVGLLACQRMFCPSTCAAGSLTPKKEIHSCAPSEHRSSPSPQPHSLLPRPKRAKPTRRRSSRRPLPRVVQLQMGQQRDPQRPLASCMSSSQMTRRSFRKAGASRAIPAGQRYWMPTEGRERLLLSRDVYEKGWSMCIWSGCQRRKNTC